MRSKYIRQQLSCDNPGWEGHGIPTLKSITKEILRQSIKYREISEIKNALLAGKENLKNFSIYRNTSINVHCPCCGWEGPAFIAKSNWRAVTYQSVCPKCDSNSRHRGIAKLLTEYLKKNPIGEALIFAPELIILNQFQKHAPNFKIYTTDKISADVDFPGEDIQNLSFQNSTFSLIICNHVLEHIQDDQKAIDECSRVLKTGGIALFTVPGDFSKNDTWIFEKLDNNGHYRYYGMDIINKMELAFSNVDAIDMNSICPQNWRVRPYDFIFVCSK